MSRIGTQSKLVLTLLVWAAASACRDVTAPSGRVAPDAPLRGAQPQKSVWTVTTLDDATTGSCTTNYCTLRDALAGAQDGERIVFKNNVAGTITLALGQLTVATDVVVDGAGRITVDAHQASRVFDVTGDVELKGLTITGGDATVYGPCDSFGWADCSGGGVRVVSGRLKVTSSTVTLNTGKYGGGLVAKLGSMTVSNSTVSGNEAIYGGGGIYGLSDTTTVVATTVSGNSGDAFGGGMGQTGGSLAVRSSTITGNTALNSGGGVQQFGSAITVGNTILAGNTLSGTFDQSTAECSSDGSFFGFTSFGHNLSTTARGCDGLFTASGDILIPSSEVFTYVLDPALKDNGGTTKTHALVERGLAVDAGYCPGESRDQRGMTRPYDDSRMPNAVDACDIGAFEWQPPSTKGSK